MWLRPSAGTLRIPDPVVGRVLVFGEGPEDYSFGARKALVPGDYDVAGYGSFPVELRGEESVGIKVGNQVFVIEVDGDRVLVAASAGDFVKSS